MGILIGFIGFTIHYQPLLEHKKLEMYPPSQSVNPILISDLISNHALNTAKFAFHELDYEPAMAIIWHEMSLPVEAMKIGANDTVVDLATYMLGACLAKANNDPKNIKIYEQAAITACQHLESLESCNQENLYKFIRKFAETDKC